MSKAGATSSSVISVKGDLISVHVAFGVKVAEPVPIHRETQHRLLYGTREAIIALLTEKGSSHTRIV